VKAFIMTKEHKATIVICTKSPSESMEIPKGGELKQSERTAGMVNRLLKGSTATTLFASSFAFAIVDRLISARNTRDSTSVVTGPSPEWWVNLLVTAVS